MKLTLSKLTDNGIWISDDRVNAFISSATDSIGEIGYHGQQPVSRNSRMLVAPDGVIRFMRSGSRNAPLPITVNTVDWTPDRVIMDNDGSGRLEIVASGNAVYSTFVNLSGEECRFIVTVNSNALNADVQGSRIWESPHVEANILQLCCRDVIVLDEWMKRKGPYAGDFLIPEHWRRAIFSRQCRSGLATYDDLRDEFRNSKMKLYNARTWITLGGDGFSLAHDRSLFRFVASVGQNSSVRFFVSFSDRKEALQTSHAPHVPREIHAPELRLNGYDSIRRFFSIVPGLVDSCIVRDIGMPRATPGAYYWVWAWDALVTALELPAWGETYAMAEIARFVNAHRDEGGAIPGRWTRGGMPMDTPPRGSLDFLHVLVILKYQHETGDMQVLLDSYPFLVDHLGNISRDLDEKGRIPNIGFYPDLPVRFGRSEQSVVTMETGASYSFCRLLETVARLLHDVDTETRARDAGERIRHDFMNNFWDEAQGFLVDSVDASSGLMNRSYPLFSLLFLQTPLGWELIREKIRDMADFIARNHRTSDGTLLVPPWDRNYASEDVTASWYPHWDIYMVKLFRRAGHAGAIVAWLNQVERLLDHLGYCPEFLRLDGFSRGGGNPWRAHGAYSNLNCITGWHRAIVEGVVGIEHDPGGMTIIPLSLPLGEVQLRRYRHRDATWNIVVENNGPVVTAIEIDGEGVHGSLKIPSSYYGKGIHDLRIRYGERAPAVRFLELVNAVILESGGNDRTAEVQIRALGTVDVVCEAAGCPLLRVDGNPSAMVWDDDAKKAYAHLLLSGEHTLVVEVGVPGSGAQ